MITLKPTFRYWIMTHFIGLLFLSLLFLTAYFVHVPRYVTCLAGLFSIVLIFNAIWSYIVLYNITYVIDLEQIIIKRGVFVRTTDYMEMYRIYDFRKQQNLLEAAFGLMNVVLLSRDMSSPTVKLIGIVNDDNLIPIIRHRVEQEKQRKHIVEFNNPDAL
jgi:membrane protein YdbS with pleckstrin-like domain